MRRAGALPAPINLRVMFRKPDVSLPSAARLWQRNVTSYSHSWQMNILPNFFEPVGGESATRAGIQRPMRPPTAGSDRHEIPRHGRQI